MNDSKEFLGKTLDAAIAEACSYYDVPRAKLEIDIIEDAKTGIFGIVGARKARIHARLATLPDFMQPPAASTETRTETRTDGKRRRSRREKNEAPEQPETLSQAEALPEAQEPTVSAPEPERAETPLPAEESAADTPEVQPSVPQPEQEEALKLRRTRQPRQPRTPAHRAPKPEAAEKTEENAAETLPPLVPLAELDQDKLLDQVRSVISHLVAPILDLTPAEVDLTIELCDDRVQASVKCEETGLLIGRDGQNLAAVQYLATRMVTRLMGAQVRVQVDAGDYHMRQDSRLQELALTLAEKVKATGKAQTTRPLSAYQRRVIHLALQDDPDVQTRSSGEGALKHVVILRRKD
ncbi:R3H domain-containing nucleic acid-binding protein [uncultured Mailhella sp.]|uniref:Jag family protein n=1 Tax=uncultured Mailhella sp. TaxID=1981031 RepID=UPI002631D334|nr:R3H domain-containing nucleic acid-binding protein [uncultured Mailhella sp.]